jgi:transcription initiation factor TFIIIB Brf1 subunit/transcription initiation factor TFIIB
VTYDESKDLAIADTSPPESDEDRELRELQSEIDALNDAREERAKPTKAEQLALKRREAKELKALEALEKEHGAVGKEIDIVQSDVGAVIVKRPTMTTYRRFQDSGKVETKDFEQLVRPCILYPSRAEFDQLVDQRPMLLAHCADACISLAGLRADQIRKK